MPNINFILPHWMYWLGLVLVPAFDMYTVRKQRGKEVDNILSKKIAYLLWFCCGFIGMHRFYLKNAWGLVYVPIFTLMLLANVQYREALDLTSMAKNEISIVGFDIELLENQIKKGDESAKAKMETVKQNFETARQNWEKENKGIGDWTLKVRILALLIALFLIIDFFLIPKMFKKCEEKNAQEALLAKETQKYNYVIPGQESQAHETLTGKVKIQNKNFNYIDKVNGYVGEFVCYWAIIAVFVYYYEVLVRYVFNSPTNWAHESMFLMFGMQYVLAAGFTHREGAHVHVDVFYRLFPTRVKAWIDIFTFIFFLIFVVALFWTGWIFAADSIRVMEVSFTEWAIQYWPVKMSLCIGALLLFLDGLTKIVKDIYIIAAKGEGV
ncbi:MAG: TRAP transporter small permease subunit [Proteobacteria bacterium]|nr:TRAP transporter small permease subunit [Pseudomonadota bacterium]